MKIKDGTNLTQDQDPDPIKGWTTPAQALDMVNAGYVGSPGPKSLHTSEYKRKLSLHDVNLPSGPTRVNPAAGPGLT